MNREFLLNILFLLTVNVLVKPFFIFGIDLAVQNRVGTEQYGTYAVLSSFTFLPMILSDFGLQNFNNRHISQHRYLFQKYFPNIFSLKIALSTFYFITTIAFAFAFGYLPKHGMLLVFLTINQILVSTTLYFRTNISGLGLYRWDSVASTLDKLLLIIFCSILLWKNSFSDRLFRIEWFVYAQTLAYSLTAIFTFGILRPHLKSLKFRVRPALWWLILKQSYPFALVVFLMTLYTRIDSVMLEKLLPDGNLQAGIYAASYRLLDATNMLGFLFASLLLPMFAQMLKAKENVAPLVHFALQLLVAASVTIAVAVFFYRKELMMLQNRNATAAWGDVLGWLIISFVAVSISYIFGTLLTANGSLMKMNRIFVFGVLLNILLNFVLIPQQKALGAAISTCLTQFAMMTAQVFLAQKEIHFLNSWNIWVRPLLFSIFLIIFSFFVTKNIENWMLGFSLTLCAGFVLAVFFKLINVGMLKEILASRK